VAFPPLHDRGASARRRDNQDAGTPVQVLGKLIAQRQIPKLWEVRSRLVELFESERNGTAA